MGKKIFNFFFIQTILSAFLLPAYGAEITEYEALTQKMGYVDFRSRRDLSAGQKKELEKYKSSSAYNCIQQFLFDPQTMQWAFFDFIPLEDWQETYPPKIPERPFFETTFTVS